jgi:hypothetical protein
MQAFISSKPWLTVMLPSTLTHRAQIDGISSGSIQEATITPWLMEMIRRPVRGRPTGVNQRLRKGISLC